MHIQNLIEVHKLIHKILSINKILTSIKGHNSGQIDKKWRALDTACILYMYIIFYQNSSICSEDIEDKHIFTSIKGHNSVVYNRIKPVYNPKPLLPDMQRLKKIGQNYSR